jgi:hypothetical protein
MRTAKSGQSFSTTRLEMTEPRFGGWKPPTSYGRDVGKRIVGFGRIVARVRSHCHHRSPTLRRIH